MSRTFMRAPYKLLADPLPTRLSRRPRGILDLPEFLLNVIFDRLNVLDRCCLALTCKALLKHASEYEHLIYALTQPPSAEQLRDFFENRLGTYYWLQGGLKYCPDCGRFVSTSGNHWRNASEVYTRERAGRIPLLWKSRREDGWLRYWIERWSERDVEEPDSGAQLLRKEDPTMAVCPRCAVQNVDCNSWRRAKMRKR